MHQGQLTSRENRWNIIIEEFTYLGSVISTDNSAQKDIKARLNKARCAFSRLKNLWKSKQYSLKTKVRIYNSNVKSVLLYGSERWRIVKRDINKVNAFHNTVAVCEGSATSSGPTKFPTTTCTRGLGAQV